ncbi:MAG: metallophosphoesterase [Spirochaetes bacterium]|nr:metallophosphoesterase [Spirochaetota bacterium]
MYSQAQYNNLKTRLVEIYQREQPPKPDDYLKVLININSVLLHEDQQVRPYDSSGLPGGIIYLKKNIPTIIVPDIHARMDFFLNIIFGEDINDETNLQKIASDALQIICVGDGVHGEKRAAKRWAKAYKEFEGDYAVHDNMDEEIRESLGLMEMVMEVKSNYPANFHFIKGNHENIKNEDGGGNYPFVKFSYEGPMMAYYIKKFYGEDFLEQYYQFEKNLPLFAVGKNFLVSHAEPFSFYNKEDILEYRMNPEVIEGLTWTADDSANDGSVQEMLEYYIDSEEDREKSYYFGGHRPVKNLYNPRAEGRFIQIHNPDKFIIAKIGENNIDLDRDIFEIENRIDEIIKK